MKKKIRQNKEIVMVCINYLKKILELIKNYIDLKDKVLISFRVLDPAQQLNAKSWMVKTLLERFADFVPDTDCELIMKQFNKYLSMKIHPESTYIKEDDVEGFWLDQYKNCKDIKELSYFLLNVCIISSSSADVERMFSLVTEIKSKKRNRLQTPMLDALLKIKMNSQVKPVNFKPSTELLSKMEIWKGIIKKRKKKGISDPQSQQANQIPAHDAENEAMMKMTVKVMVSLIKNPMKMICDYNNNHIIRQAINFCSFIIMIA